MIDELVEEVQLGIRVGVGLVVSIVSFGLAVGIAALAGWGIYNLVRYFL